MLKNGRQRTHGDSPKEIARQIYIGTLGILSNIHDCIKLTGVEEEEENEAAKRRSSIGIGISGERFRLMVLIPLKPSSKRKKELTLLRL